MPVKTFVISHGSIRIKVKLLPAIADVHQEHQITARRCGTGKTVLAYFMPAQRAGKIIGTIVLPADGRLRELVPHEVTHAVIHTLNGVLSHDDEACATAIGRLSSTIFRRVELLGVAL